MDPSPHPKNRRMDPVTFDALVELRRLVAATRSGPSASERLLWFINEILEMTIRTLPREIRRAWKGSASVDATVIPAFARPARTQKRKRKGQPLVTVRHSRTLTPGCITGTSERPWTENRGQDDDLGLRSHLGRERQ